jgi:ankyrin repeat protein
MVLLSALFSSLFFTEVYANDTEGMESDVLTKELVESIKDNSLARLRELLNSGADPNTKIDGFPIIFYTVIDSCKQSFLKELLINGAAVNVNEDISKTYPLHWSATHTNMQCFDLLIEKGANPLVVDQEERNLYFFALEFSNIEILQSIFDLEVDLMQKNIYGVDAVHQSILLKEPLFFRKILLQSVVSKNNKASQERH